MATLIKQLQEWIMSIENTDERIAAINAVKLALHEVSPLKNEPVDCVLWVKSDSVQANDYNPNSVAAPEMRLLEKSIEADGYTQPIVTYRQDTERESYLVVDGFHRSKVGKSHKPVLDRCNGYLPITRINGERADKADRIAATIRHNRARGKHGVEQMGEIVIELARRNWDEKKIAKELGMEPDEVLRLKQITGLAEMFANQQFSEAWEST